MILEELKKMLERRIVIQDMYYARKVCYGRLGKNPKGKVESGQGFMDSGYTRFIVSAPGRTNGLMDQMKLSISDVTGLEQETEGKRMVGPELRSYKDSVWWNCEMEEEDHREIVEVVNGHLSLFQSEELVQEQKEDESQGQEVQSGALSGNILT